MNFVDAVKSCLTNYVTFQGRALRSEYWYFALFYFILSLIASLIDNLIIGQPIFEAIVALGLVLPHLAVFVRRLHDTDRSGWWIFLGAIPLIGAIVLLVWLCTQGSAGDNRFGPTRSAGAGPRIAAPFAS